MFLRQIFLTFSVAIGPFNKSQQFNKTVAELSANGRLKYSWKQYLNPEYFKEEYF